MYNIQADIDQHKALINYEKNEYFLAITQNVTAIYYSIKSNKDAFVGVFLDFTFDILGAWEEDAKMYIDDELISVLRYRFTAITNEFEGNPIYKSIEARFLEAKQRVDQKIKDYESSKEAKTNT